MNIVSLFRTGFIWMLLSGTCLATEITQAYLRSFEVEDFQRLTEFFTGEEVAGDRLILRTDPEERAGMYVVATLDSSVSSLPSGSTAELQVLFENTREITTLAFPFPASRPQSKHLLVGITGSTWEDEAKVIAWRLQLKDAAGTVLAEHKSFLWEMPK
ncbi:MAG: hypothetical protein JW739_01780 [Opitutales bacterium]|nr:hypothetical protein [Opitutales bacterium]